MNIFTNKSIWKKIAIALVIVLLFQFVVTSPVHADAVEFGGKLMSPILSLLVSLGDGIMDIIGRTIMGAHSTLYEVDMVDSFWATLGTILVALVVAALVICAVILTCGAAVVVAAAVGVTVTASVGIGTFVAAGTAAIVAAVWFNDQVLPDNLYLPMYTYSAEEIFKGNILLFDVDFFGEQPTILVKHGDDGEIQYYYYINENGEEIKTSNQSAAADLRKVISAWYNGIRNICIVLMLSVLVYIGIRMLLSSVASDKAKYLTMLKDWFIGLCLLFLMHYIMAFSVVLVEKLTEVVKSSVDSNGYTVTIQANDKIKKAAEDLGLDKEYISEGTGEDGKKADFLVWPTNLMGSLRIQLQMEQYGAQYVGLSICFLMLCAFTLYFTIIYLKRFLYMAFLTLIAPMVALTYCIDKINDGQAQGFNKWFKEYIFNLLLQPMHLLLYFILVTSAFELASTNVIYSIVALGFLIPAEKLLRSLFGFEKSQTAKATGTAGALMASTALSHMLNRGRKGNKGEGKGEDGQDDSLGRVPLPREANPAEAFLDGQGNTTQPIRDGQNSGLPQGQDDQGPGQQQPGGNYGDTNGGINGASGIELPDSVRMDMAQERARQERLEQEKAQQEAEKRRQEAEARRQQIPSTRRARFANAVKSASKKAGRRAKRTLHASWAAQKANMKSTPQRFKRRIEKSHPIRMVGKLAAGAAAATAAGALGVAIGATTGDLGSVAKIGGSAITGGYALGSGFAKNRQSPMDREEIRNVQQEAYNKGYKGEYKQDAMNDYVSNYLKDVGNRNYFEQKFGKKEAKEMMQNGEIEEYLYNDITDRKDIAAAIKLEREHVVKNRDEAIAVAQLGKMINEDTNNMTTRRRNQWKDRLGELASESGVKDTETFANNRMKELDKFHDFKK